VVSVVSDLRFHSSHDRGSGGSIRSSPEAEKKQSVELETVRRCWESMRTNLLQLCDQVPVLMTSIPDFAAGFVHRFGVVLRLVLTDANCHADCWSMKMKSPFEKV
jgi:hypothetical protein